VAPHHLGGRDSRQIGGTLMLAARAERLAEPEQHERPRQCQFSNPIPLGKAVPGAPFSFTFTCSILEPRTAHI
jgi:hypothetical protein